MTVAQISEVAERSNPESLLPTITLPDDFLNEEIDLQAEGRNITGYTNADDEHNTVYTNASKDAHEIGIFGEAAFSLYYEGTLNGFDNRLSWNGDDGLDVVCERDNIDIHVDVKTTRWGYSEGRVPHLKVKRDHHREADNLIYFLVEQIDNRTARMIGYIHSSRVPSAGVEADEGERVFEDKSRWAFTSSADNYVVPAPELRAVWREWSEDDV